MCIRDRGGVEGMEKLRTLRSSMLYDTLDNSRLFHCHAEKGSRSGMNVTFRTGNEELDAKFVQEAAAAGFTNLKGHRKTGGMRASIYNACLLYTSKLLFTGQPDRLHKLLYLLFKRRDPCSLRLKFLVFRTGNAYHLRVAYLLVYYIFHG